MERVYRFLDGAYRGTMIRLKGEAQKEALHEILDLIKERKRNQ